MKPDDICRNYHGGNPESEIANTRTRKAHDIDRILAYLRAHADATCDEVEVALGMSHQTASARLAEMKRAGQVQLTGVKRRTRTGSPAAVVRIPPPPGQMEMWAPVGTGKW